MLTDNEASRVEQEMHAYASRLLKGLQAAGDTNAWTYDKDTLSLRCGDRSVFTGHVAARYVSEVAPGVRAELLASDVRAAIAAIKDGHCHIVLN